MRRSIIRHLALAAAAAAAALIAAPSVADARPDAGNGRAHWTTERLDRAIPRDMLRPGGGGGGGGSTGSGWTGTDVVRRSTGKVFFTLGSVDYVCSGSTVVDGNTSVTLVLTAGHCVEDGASGGFATNWTYIPDYERWTTRSCVSDPDRCFAASRLVTSSAWASSGDFNYDVAFGVVARELPAQWVAQAIGFNQPRSQMMYSFGYPAAGKYNGQKLIYCNGTVRDDPYGALDQGMSCGMTGGSSGGPWYIGFDPVTGLGTANSLNSYKYSNDNRTMYGPYFGNYAQAIYDAARTGTGANTAVSAPAVLP